MFGNEFEAVADFDNFVQVKWVNFVEYLMLTELNG